MAYNNNVPLSGQRIKDTQQPINDNFAAIDTLIAVNHEAFNTADAGKHKFVTLTEQGGAPVIAAADAGIFFASSALTATKELFFKKGAASALEMTAGALGTSGWALFPIGNGLLAWWTRYGAVSAGSNTVTYTTHVASFPTFSGSPYIALATPFATANTLLVTGYTATTVTFTASANGSAQILVIGPK